MSRQQKQTCQLAIMDLMTDHKARTSEQIADLIGFSHGRVRSELAKNFLFAKEKRIVPGGGKVTYHQLIKRRLKPVAELLEQGTGA